MTAINYAALAPEHFDQVIALGVAVHGDNYLTDDSMQTLYAASFKDGINASLVAMDGDKLVGFRLTMAAGNWAIDQWCTPDKWGVAEERVCYFKCNTVDADYRGHGIGSEMLRRSVAEARKQGALAGVAHIWLASPGNSAFGYFSAAGATLVKEHPDKWLALSQTEGYHCPVCQGDCHCIAAEMILRF